MTAGAKDRSTAAIAFLPGADESAARVLSDMTSPTSKANPGSDAKTSGAALTASRGRRAQRR